MAFQPSLFIGIGAHSHFFTLRESYLHVWYTKNARGEACPHTEVRSFHHFNLSQDPDEAIEKAKDAASRFGLPLINSSREEIAAELNEIHRRNAEQMAEAAAREQRWKEEKAAAELEKRANWKKQIDAGYFPECFRARSGPRTIFFIPDGAMIVPFEEWIHRDDRLLEYAAEGKESNPDWDDERAMRYARAQFSGNFYDYHTQRDMYKIADAEISYLSWLMNTYEKGEFEKDSLIELVAIKALEICAERRLPKPDPTAVIGNPKDKIKVHVTVIRSFQFSGYYGLVDFVTMVTDDGVCLMSKGAFQANVGDKLTIKATIKKHDEYKGQAQTVIQRVKIVQD